MKDSIRKDVKKEISRLNLIECLNRIKEINDDTLPDIRDVVLLSGILVRLKKLESKLCRKDKLVLVYDAIGYCVYSLLKLSHEINIGKRVYMLINEEDIECGRLFSLENTEFPNSVDLYPIYLANYRGHPVPDFGRIIPVYTGKDYWIGLDKDGYCSGIITNNGIEWDKYRDKNRSTAEFLDLILSDERGV